MIHVTYILDRRATSAACRCASLTPLASICRYLALCNMLQHITLRTTPAAPTCWCLARTATCCNILHWVLCNALHSCVHCTHCNDVLGSRELQHAATHCTVHCNTLHYLLLDTSCNDVSGYRTPQHAECVCVGIYIHIYIYIYIHICIYTDIYIYIYI